MKLGKILIGLVLAIVAVVAVVIVIGLQNINQLVKLAVESAGTEVTRTGVGLQRVDIQLSEGRGELYDLVVANPEGYNSDYALKLGEVALQVEPQSLTGGVIVINEVRIAGAQLIAEQRDLTRSNLTDLLNNMKSPAGGSDQPAPAAQQSDSAEEVRLAVEKISFADNSVRLISEQWGERTLQIPTVELSNIGDRETGLTPPQLAQAVLAPLLERARKAVSSELREQAKDAAEEKLKEKLGEQLDDKQKENLDKLKNLLGR